MMLLVTCYVIAILCFMIDTTVCGRNYNRTPKEFGNRISTRSSSYDHAALSIGLPRARSTSQVTDPYIQFLENAKEQSLTQGNRRMGTGRVSFRECNLPTEERQNCGYYGIREQECYMRECCWGGRGNEGGPACYHSKPTMQQFCSIDGPERNACGFLGIRKEQCVALECCWRPTNQAGVPWCFEIRMLPIFEGECGVPAIRPNTLSRIVNGVDARPNSWPWMVSLQVDEWHFCGGSLINEQWVVSAAHCEGGFYYGEESSIVLGLHSQSGNVTTDYEPLRVGIEAVIPHQDFGSTAWIDHDIMLIKLDQPVTFTDSISPVCLSDLGQTYPAGEYCYTTGWGNTMFMGESPDLLQQLMTPMVDTALCNSTDWYAGQIDATNVCAGYEEGGRSGCHGDSGGPLVCRDAGHWNLVGIVSWGEQCAMERRPGVYAEVADFPDWIQNTISRHP